MSKHQKAGSYAESFEDIPGTTVFDAAKSRMGYHMNMLCMSLMKPENRIRFKSNESSYLDDYPLTSEQREAILTRDYNRMIELGGCIFFLIKIGATDGKSVLSVVSGMAGTSPENYMQMMVSGGRPIKGNRSLKDWGNCG